MTSRGAKFLAEERGLYDVDEKPAEPRPEDKPVPPATAPLFCVARMDSDILIRLARFYGYSTVEQLERRYAA